MQEVTIEDIDHQGRGVAKPSGKVVFVEGALLGERLKIDYRRQRKKYSEAVITEVIEPSALRQTPVCSAFGVCGGCSLQHLSPDVQLAQKEAALIDQYAQFADLNIDQLETALTGPSVNYRRKARLGARYVPKKGGVLVGFRERQGRYLADMNECVILAEPFDQLITPLRDLLSEMDAKDQIPQIEVASADNAAAMVVRHLNPLSSGDRRRLLDFSKTQNVQLFLQGGGPKTVIQADPTETLEPLFYKLPEFDVKIQFSATDFIQVNAEMNQKMLNQAIAWLAPKSGERVLDLFCGVGNISLPLARHFDHVVAVEGEAAMVQKGQLNAKLNHINNIHFYQYDLKETLQSQTWAKENYDVMVLDPPRSGAQEVVEAIEGINPQRLLYISCNPATMARDAGILTHQKGYRCVKLGAMDMFPHTTHLEAMALFVRD